MAEKEMNINLTFSQVENLAEFFELDFIDHIRNYTEIDNINYVVDMCEIYSKLKAHLRKEENRQK